MEAAHFQCCHNDLKSIFLGVIFNLKWSKFTLPTGQLSRDQGVT